MKSAITFDTMQYMTELKESGMKQEEAEAITRATSKALGQMIESKEVATKSDLLQLKIDLTKTISDTMWKTVGILVAFQTLTIGILHFFK